MDGWKVGGQKGGSWGGEEWGGTRKWMAASASGERGRDRETAGGINGMADAEVGDRRGEKPREGREGRRSIYYANAEHRCALWLCL